MHFHLNITKFGMKSNFCKLSIARKVRKKEEKGEKRRKVCTILTFNIEKMAEKW